MSRLAPASVRGKAVMATAVAMTIFGLVVSLGSFALVSQVARVSAEEVLAGRVAEVSAQVRDHAAEGDDPIDLGIVEQSNPVFLQVMDTSGAIVATTPGLDPDVRLCPASVPAATVEDTLVIPVGGEEGTFLRTVSPVETPRGTLGVCAIVSGVSIERARSAVLLALLIVLPLVIAGVCLAVWLAVGRALGAVDDLRRQAEQMDRESDPELVVQATGDEVERLGRTLNRLLADLHQQSTMTRRFVADAGHELRNPLTTLRLSLEFGSDGTEVELRAAMSDALADLNRLEVLVQDLLALARSDAMEATAHFEQVDLTSIVLGAVEGIRRTRPEVDIELDIDPCAVDGDETGLRSMAVNLCDNAARHAVGSVRVGLHQASGQVMLTVDDDGVGLLAEDCGRVFDRFVRLDEARVRDEGGSGLGLAIVASVAGTHGGSARALPGPGGHFVVTLSSRGGHPSAS